MTVSMCDSEYGIGSTITFDVDTDVATFDVADDMLVVIRFDCWSIPLRMNVYREKEEEKR